MRESQLHGQIRLLDESILEFRSVLSKFLSWIRGGGTGWAARKTNIEEDVRRIFLLFRNPLKKNKEKNSKEKRETLTNRIKFFLEN